MHVFSTRLLVCIEKVACIF